MSFISPLEISGAITVDNIYNRWWCKKDKLKNVGHHGLTELSNDMQINKKIRIEQDNEQEIARTFNNHFKPVTLELIWKTVWELE